MRITTIFLCATMLFGVKLPQPNMVDTNMTISNVGFVTVENGTGNYKPVPNNLDEEPPVILKEAPTLEEILKMDLTKPSGVTAEALRNALLHDLGPLAEVYISKEENGVNAVFRAAQDALESGWGRYCFEPNNISGFVTQESFDSKEECVDFVTQKVIDWYLTPPNEDDSEIGKFYNGKTLYDVSIKYCPTDGVHPNYHYGKEIAKIMLEIYQKAII